MKNDGNEGTIDTKIHMKLDDSFSIAPDDTVETLDEKDLQIDDDSEELDIIEEVLLIIKVFQFLSNLSQIY